ncbi:MAG: tetratricopeptide repeat protein [Polyangiaceae bacterium]|nr:tetratricopeptide repeat protein [Polyangiaceae bacterium]
MAKGGGEGSDCRRIAELEAAVRRDPANPARLWALGEAYLAAGGLERASVAFRGLLLLRLPGEPPITRAAVLHRLGLVHHRQGESSKTILMLERALEADPNRLEARELLAQLRC